MARNTVGSVIDRTLRQLNSSIRNELNTLANNVALNDTQLTFTFDLTPAVRLGTVLSVGLELMRVLAVDTNTKTVDVLRGWQDSPIQTHTAGAEVLINPRFTRFDVYDAMIDELTSWEPDLFKVVSYEWTVEDDDETVEVPFNLRYAIGVVRLTRQWEGSDSSSWPSLKYRLQRGDPAVWSGANTSGLVIRFVPFNNVQRNGKLHALLAYPYIVGDDLEESDDLVTDVGLDRSMLDLLVFGVKTRLLSDDESNRASRQPADESRRAGDVPVNRGLEVAATMRGNYLRRYNAEVMKLRVKYPLSAW